LSRSRLHPFERAVLGTVARRRLFERGARLLVAVSGGADSTALVAVLAALRDAGELSDVHACHVDHGLRPGSVQDGDFCASLCASLGISLRRVAVTVPTGGSIQAAARRVRYRALRAAASACGAGHVATGHTRGDQAETVLHRLLRGSGARGLAGIPARRGNVVRPLIDRSRSEIVAYLRDRGLSWREDPTNASPRFLRNRIRHELLPLMNALTPEIERRLATTAGLLRDDDRALERLAAVTVGAGAKSAPVAALLGVPRAVRRRAIRRLWRAATGSRRDLGAEHVDAVAGLLRRKPPGRVALPRGLEARVAYGLLEIATPVAAPASFGPVVIERSGSYAIPGQRVVEIGWSSADEPPWPLELRTRLPGDRFHPAHGRGSKKLKEWLIDRKVPRWLRGALVVVADRGGRVWCVPELGVSSAGGEKLVVSVRPEGSRPSSRGTALQPAVPAVIKGTSSRRVLRHRRSPE
jgi:tRNA(Ile)-lysidine synthase